jgi:hypothetical protein
MCTVNIHEAETHLSRPVEPGDGSRRLGGMEGMFTVPGDFDRMDEDEIAGLFEGSD